MIGVDLLSGSMKAAATDRAISFAAIAFAGRKRIFNDDPYVVAALETMCLVRSALPDSEDAAVAAVLQDAVSMTGVTAKQIGRRFGDAVRQLVEGCTGPHTEIKHDELTRLHEQPAEVQTIKAASLIVSIKHAIHNGKTNNRSYLHKYRDTLSVLTKSERSLYREADALLFSCDA